MNTPRHAPMDRFPIVGGELQVGGMPLRALAERVGRTPFYAYDRCVIDEQVALLRRCLPEAVRLHYAIKANPLPALVRHLAEQVDGLDVASLAELRLALDTGLPASAISFAGPGKTDEELAAATEAGVVLNVESAGELERLAAVGERLGQRPRVALRVNPDFELRGSGMKMGGGARPFGIDAEQVPGVLRRVAELDLEWLGFHIFSGSQNLDAEAIAESQRLTLELALRLASDAPAPLRWLNIGGGLGIPYFPGDSRLDPAPIGERLGERLPDLQQAHPGVEVVMELGRFLVGEAGIYVCEVIDRKVSRGELFLVTNGGMHHHLAASGNLGQVVRRNFPVAVGNRMDQPADTDCHVVGPLCTPLDILASKVRLPAAAPGDLIVVFQSGAYGLSASPTGFLGHPVAAEILV